MSDTDFLKKVQPSGGLTVIVGINPANKDDVVPRFAGTDAETEQAIAYFKRRGFHTYYGVAKYATPNNRLATNVQELQAFWLDIDCTPGKGYDTKDEGQEALDAFVALLGLPTPITVDSGNGLHAYWLLTEAIGPAEWRAVSDALKARCKAEGFHVDPSVMEEARVMRVPGTENYKSDPPLPVTELVTDTTPLSLAEFAEKVGVAAPKPGIFGKSGRGPSKLGKALAEGANQYAPADFDKVTVACQHLAACVANRATLSEPLWRAALSVAIRCTDPELAVAEVSKDWVGANGAEYDQEDAMAKALATKGPYTCRQFDDLTEPNTPGCDGCPFRTKNDDGTTTYKYVSPIRTGEIQFMPGGATARTQPLPVEEDIPTFPLGYYRPDNGGVMKLVGDPEKNDIRIYDHDLYVAQRLYSDKSETEAFVLRLHLPHDPVREFSIASGMLGDRNLKKFLYEKGLTFGSEAGFILVKNYLDAFVSHWQNQDKATPVYEQLGWTDDGNFILGSQKISAVDVGYSPPSPITRSISDAMHSAGTLSEWKRVFAIYGEPGMEGHAFAALTGFGAPLYKFLGQNGAVIHLISPDSGTGKTTTLHMVNSIYGNPKKLLSTPDDTYNARVAKLGIMNNLPFCADEMTNMLPEDVSRLLYSMSQGRGKDRMQGASNTLRENNTTWQTISLCSSNSSFSEKLQSIKSNPDGELMRLLEFYIEKRDMNVNQLNKALIDKVLLENYGHAGPIYISYLVRNQRRAAVAVNAMQDELIAELNVEQHERFWVSTVAANLTGGFIAGSKLNLLDGWDMPRIRDWALSNFRGMRQERALSLRDAEGVLGSFINLYYGKIVTVNGSPLPGKSRASGMPLIPMHDRKDEVIIRCEPDTKRLYVDKDKFADFCTVKNIDAKSIYKELENRKILLNRNKLKRMAANLGVASPPTLSLEFDHSHAAFSGIAIPNAVGT